MKMTGFWNDLRFAMRGLFRAQGFVAITIGTLALGIGAVTAISTVVNGVLLKPLPFDDPDALVGVWHTAPGAGLDQVGLSTAMSLAYRDENRFFEDIEGKRLELHVVLNWAEELKERLPN